MTLPAKYKKAFKDYALAVAASAITLGVALASELEPHYAVLIGAIAGPLIKWADKNSKDYGVGSK
jgi:adenine/guanine phosphoribosyltransferase-like PRPP-binding protein